MSNHTKKLSSKKVNKVAMPDLMESLASLQLAVTNNQPLMIQRCLLNSKYSVIIDQVPSGPRFTYAIIVRGIVQVMANFALAESNNGWPCFNVGYAVAPQFRGKGLAAEAVKVGIEEMKNGFKSTGQEGFYVEAVIDELNSHSIKVAESIFGMDREKIIDKPSGTPSLHFIKRIEF